MPGGLAALLDDVAAIAKIAAASVDDIAAGAGRAGAKAAGVVIDDAAVTPRYVTGFTPDRELPIIGRIAKGSMINKLFIITPVALLLSIYLPFLITPILILGGTYLCYEGAEKVWEWASGKKHDLAEQAAILNDPDHEKKMVSGAIRTDFILSIEIMVIALAQVTDLDWPVRAAVLVAVAIAITVGVYGAVALIVKMDDIGLHLAARANSGMQTVGEALVKAMPVVMQILSVVGIAAMIWVGGGIIVHGLAEYGVTGPEHVIHDIAESVSHALNVLPGLVGWLVGAVGAGLLGLAWGGLIVAIHHAFTHRTGH